MDKNTQIFLETVVLSQKNSIVARIFLFPSDHGDAITGTENLIRDHAITGTENLIRDVMNHQIFYSLRRKSQDGVDYRGRSF